MADKKNLNHKIGRRKEAVARAKFYVDLKESITVNDEPVKKGDIFVNGKKIENYFSGLVFKAIYEEPFKITNTLGKYTIIAKINGGGQKSQLESFVHAVSRAIAELDDKYKHILKKKGLLTRDSRVRQRRKVGMGGKSRRKRQSPKR